MKEKYWYILFVFERPEAVYKFLFKYRIAEIIFLIL